MLNSRVASVSDGVVNVINKQNETQVSEGASIRLGCTIGHIGSLSRAQEKEVGKGTSARLGP